MVHAVQNRNLPDMFRRRVLRVEVSLQSKSPREICRIGKRAKRQGVTCPTCRPERCSCSRSHSLFMQLGQVELWTELHNMECSCTDTLTQSTPIMPFVPPYRDCSGHACCIICGASFLCRRYRGRCTCVVSMANRAPFCAELVGALPNSQRPSLTLV